MIFSGMELHGVAGLNCPRQNWVATRRSNMKASFRDYINTLRKHNELLEITKPVDLRDVAALVAQSEKALLFKNLPGYSMPVVSGLLQSRSRIALGMGVAYENIGDKLGKAMDNPLKPKRVANAPVKEVV